MLPTTEALIIGSYALYLRGLRPVPPRDVDIVCDRAVAEELIGPFAEHAPGRCYRIIDGLHYDIDLRGGLIPLAGAWQDRLPFGGRMVRVARPDFVATLRRETADLAPHKAGKIADDLALYERWGLRTDDPAMIAAARKFRKENGHGR